MKKIISAILALTILTGAFTGVLSVSAQSAEEGEVLFEEHFDDAELSVPAVYYNNDGTASVTGGKLIIDRVSNVKNSYTGAELYVDSSKAVRTGRFAVSFVLSRESENNVNFPVVFYGAAGYKYPYLSMTWRANGELSAIYAATEGGSAAENTVGVYDTSELEVSVEFDTEKKTYSLILNGTKELDNVYPRSAQAQGLWCVYFSLEKANIATVGVDDFTVQLIPDEPPEEPSAVVEKDYNALSEDMLLKVPPIDGLIEDSLFLPEHGDAGSDISWTCDREDIISSSGDLRSLPDEDTQINLRARISCGDAERYKDFSFTVKGSDAVDYSLPTRYIYEERFDDGKIDDRIVCYQSGGPIEEKNGELSLTYQGGSYTGVDIFPDSGHSEMTGRFAVSFIMNRPEESAGNIPIQFYGPSYSTSYMAMDWRASGEVLLNYAEKAGNIGEVKSLGSFDNRRLKVLAEFDFTDNTFSLWLNNEKVLDKMYPRDPSVISLRSVWIYPDNSAPLILSIDDFLVYKLMEDMPDSERVALDAEALSLKSILTDAMDMPDSTNSNLSLYSVGDYGSKISWKSSNEELISSDGRVNVPDAESGYAVLRAEITCGSATAVKEILINVPAKSLPEAQPPEVSGTILYDSFDTDTVNPAFSLTEDGGRIEPGDGNLIIERSGNTGTTILDMYNDAAHTPAYGFVGTTFTMSRTKASNILVRMRGGGGENDYLALTWNSSSQIVVKIPSSAPGGATTDIAVAECGNTVTLTTLYDTDSSRFSLWVNGKPVVRNAYSRYSGVYSHLYTRIYMENTNYNTVKLSDYHIFNAIPGDINSVITDVNLLTADAVVEGGMPDNLMVQTNLSLPAYGSCGTRISWITGPGIAEDGTVSRPVGGELETYVIAIVEKNGISTAKKIDLTVMRTFGSQQEQLETDAALITYQALTNQDPQEITKALKLSPSGKYGTAIVWESDNPDVISAAGRVVRPYYDKSPKTVTLTAKLSCGSAQKVLSFTFTVLPDEEPTDPNYMSDEEFFGAWGGNEWTVTGKLDYTKPALKPVEAAVMKGDYPAAKAALLEEIRNRENKQTVSMSERSPLWASMVIDEIYHQSGDQYLQGEFIASGGDYKKYEIVVKPANIAKGSNTSYCIMGRYNENSEFEIATTRNEDSGLHPYLELVVNGKTIKLSPAADSGIRAGDYMDQNYGSDPVMKVKTMGEFLGNDTYKAMLRFNFSDISEGDTVESAKLVLYGRITPSYVTEKSILVLLEPTNLWENSTATWNNFPGYVFNYNGVEGGNTWNAIPGCDQEYTFQAPRFWAWTPAALEYSITGDEKYAYNVLKISMDYINDKGGYTKFTDGAWIGMVIRGGYPRTLDAAIRLQQWSLMFDIFAQSRYMTPEVCTAMLKHMWDIGDALTLATLAHSPNWMQTENMALLQAGLAFAEFTDSEEWIEFACSVLEPMIFNNHFSDGSYLESTLGYNESSLKTFMQYKRLMFNNGREVSPEYDEMLIKAAYYACVMKGINGRNIQYGDEQGGLKSGASYSEMVQWYGDEVLQYIDSMGTAGARPDWTSMHFEDSQMTAMRSGWNKNGLALYTNVRGGGDGHGHADDNTVTVIGYDQILISDSGVFTYTDTDPLRKWGRTTRAHNTVEINNTSQRVNWATRDEGGTWGSTQDWSTNSKYDFLSQTTRSYDELGFSHKRSITFAKKGFWIVSDRIDALDKTKANDYKQIWHMLPTSGMSFDAEKGQLLSNFASGGNIIVASADDDISLVREEGWYDYTYAQVQDAPFGYFEKKDSVGDTTFDTVLLPYQGTEASITTERIDMGVDTSDITAVKFNYTANGENAVVYYMLDYTSERQTKQIEGYSTDASMLVVCEDARGNLTDVYMQNGTSLTKNGAPLISLAKRSYDFSYTNTGPEIEIVFSDSGLDNSDIKAVQANAVSVYVNGEQKKFSAENGMITPGDETASAPEDDKHISVKPDQGGSSGGAGGTGSTGSTGGGTGGGSGGISGGGMPGTAAVFNDISGHWAEKMILSLAQRGIAKGENGSFYPDRTVTRAEAVALVNRTGNIADMQYQGGYSDVDGSQWYAGAVEAAAESGIIARDTVFRPNDPITREELAKIITVLAQIKGRTLSDGDLNFGDLEDISGWADVYVRKAYASGFIRGDGEGNFLPKNHATRAELVSMLYQYLETAVN